MTIKKFIISLVFMAIVALTVVACSGTKNICPAYTDAETETPVSPRS
jgi:hypothetical protein